MGRQAAKKSVRNGTDREGRAVVLRISGLRVQRGVTTIVRDLKWQVNAGEHWVILGSNGCGKTSLLKALTGFLAPSAGDFAVLGQRYGESDWRELRLKIGVVTSAFAAAIPPAEKAVDTVMSGKFAQLDLWAPVTRADRAQAQAWLRVVGATRIAEREWIYLSQGERQRVLIARALMAWPRLLIFDEPCAGLDPVAREDFLKLIDRFGRRRSPLPPAMILVTHHVEEIMPMFTHALLLRRGEVVASGPMSDTLTSRNLSRTFGAEIKLARRNRRFQLRVA